MSDVARAAHINECIEQIEKALAGYDFDKFNADPILRLATVKLLEIIGEAANNISNEVKDKNTGIEWHKIVGLRNLVVHEYFRIDYGIIWDAATVFVPALKKEIETINLSTE